MCDFQQQIIEYSLPIDRQKLLAMIHENDEGRTAVSTEEGKIFPVDQFFKSIMRKTQTVIVYPRKMQQLIQKYQMRRSSLYVKIMGIPFGVKIAKELVNQKLKFISKIEMRIDVSWNHHLYILGEKGTKLQKIKNKSGLHIQFPDKNRYSEDSKLNRIQIFAQHHQIEDIERARSEIRMRSPLIYEFIIPITEDLLEDPSELGHKLCKKYNVNIIIYYSEVILPLYECIVEGNICDADDVKAATSDLIQGFCGSLLGPEVLVRTKMEMQFREQHFIFGQNNEILTKIMQETSTTIALSEVPVKDTKTITICGSIENVDIARQNIIGYFPIIFKFQLLEDVPLEHLHLDQLKRLLDIDIWIKSGNRDGLTSVYFKSAEKNVDNIYKIWTILRPFLDNFE